MPDHYLAFWNVENLFDVEDSPHRTEKLQRTLQGELKGWDAGVLDRKISQLAAIIGQMNDNRGPDVLGVCEIENEQVLERLRDGLASLGRNYGIAHHDTGDARGIDVAFFYDQARFTAAETFAHVIMKRSATREIFQVNLKSAAGRDPVVVGNHWPARSEGIWESEPYRMSAGETLSYWLQRIQEMKGRDVGVVAMGDFNDQPFDRSISHYAQAGWERGQVTRATGPRMLNLMWRHYAAGVGSYYFNNAPLILDQFMVSRGLLTGKSKFTAREDAADILMFDAMRRPGQIASPVRFGRPSAKSSFNQNGFSDHYPIGMRIREA